MLGQKWLEFMKNRNEVGAEMAQNMNNKRKRSMLGVEDMQSVNSVRCSEQQGVVGTYL